MREKLDHLRTMLMREPRGHFDMYGALVVESDLPEADLAVLFMHNEGNEKTNKKKTRYREPNQLENTHKQHGMGFITQIFFYIFTKHGLI